MRSRQNCISSTDVVATNEESVVVSEDSIQPANSPAYQEPPDSGPTTATTECQDNEAISQTSSELETSISSSAM